MSPVSGIIGRTKYFGRGMRAHTVMWTRADKQSEERQESAMKSCILVSSGRWAAGPLASRAWEPTRSPGETSLLSSMLRRRGRAAIPQGRR